MLVTRDAFEEALAEVAASAAGPREGVFGPGSTMWRVAREGAVFLAAGRAALLQLAHPEVAWAIAHHSDTRRDPVGRFNRTFHFVNGMIFGDLDSAVGAARRVYAIHERITGVVEEQAGAWHAGQAYAANHSPAQLWVLATLVHSAIEGIELAMGPMPHHEREAYWQQAKQFGRLFAIPLELFPDDFPAFDRWFHVQCSELEVPRPGRELGRALLTSPHRAGQPFWLWYRSLTASLLPENLRRGYGLRHGRRERALLGPGLVALRAGYPTLPRRLRYQPAYIEAVHRLRGEEVTDRVGRTLEQLALGLLAPAPGRQG